MNPAILKEKEFINSIEYQLGDYLYMGMGLVKNTKVCISVAYKIDYCIRKAREFESLDSNVTFTHVNKVKVGELQECEKFFLDTEIVP